MTNIKIITSSEENILKKVKLTDANLWMEPTIKKEDADFWIHRFKDQRIPYVLAQYDTELVNAQNEKMYRRVYGLFIDMKAWEAESAKQ